jgi:hypothetical protein
LDDEISAERVKRVKEIISDRYKRFWDYKKLEVPKQIKHF